MKDILLIGIVLFVIVALFGDGGLEISPELSPSFDAALDINYAPDRSVTTTTIEQQVNNYIERQVEHETVIVNTQPATSGTSNNNEYPRELVGVAIVDGRPSGQCMTVPGDVILTHGSNGECRVTNGGQKYFVAPSGVRTWLGAETSESVAPVQPQVPATTSDDRWAALVPLDELDTKQLQAAYLRNGGKLPLGFRLWTDKEKRNYLAARAESWR